jgi:hypothetical protein
MADGSDPKERAAKLRERIAKLKPGATDSDRAGGEDPAGPRPGESPHAYVERRMRETLKPERGTRETQRNDKENR